MSRDCRPLIGHRVTSLDESWEGLLHKNQPCHFSNLTQWQRQRIQMMSREFQAALLWRPHPRWGGTQLLASSAKTTLRDQNYVDNWTFHHKLDDCCCNSRNQIQDYWGAALMWDGMEWCGCVILKQERAKTNCCRKDESTLLFKKTLYVVTSSVYVHIHLAL